MKMCVAYMYVIHFHIGFIQHYKSKLGTCIINTNITPKKIPNHKVVVGLVKEIINNIYTHGKLE